MELEEKDAYHSPLAYRDLPRILHLSYQGIKLSFIYIHYFFIFILVSFYCDFIRFYYL